MTCTHERRRYWDCGCAPRSAADFCSYCEINSQCMECDALLEARPNVLDEETCSVCGDYQFGAPGGLVCRAGHGGAPTVLVGVAPGTTLARIVDDAAARFDSRPIEHASVEAREELAGREAGKPDRRADRRRVRDRVNLQPRDPDMPTVEEFKNGEPKPRKRRATIGRRPKVDADLSDSTCTPRWLAELLYETHGPFDIDPCSNPRSWIVARQTYSLEKKLDGLRLPWPGSAFKNNPFSLSLPWQEKARYEMSIGRCTELVELCKLDPGTEWWEEITSPILIGAMHRGRPDLGLLNSQEYFPDLWLFHKRVQYDEHPELIERRAREYAEQKAAGIKKPKGRPDGKSSNNFCSAIIHWRFDLPPLKLEKYATLWRR